MSSLNPQILVQIGLSIVAVLLYFLITSLIKSAVLRYSRQQKLIGQQVVYIRKFLSITFILVLLFSLTIIWGIDFRGILIFASSFFAVVGIALFASWSILSNITSSIILFFSFPYKLGDRIRIIDGENSIEGVLVDMTMFSLQIRDDADGLISYPNNLAMQKPINKVKQPARQDRQAGLDKF